MVETVVPENAQAAPAETPASLTPDQIQEVIAKAVQAAVDTRIPGLQSAYDKQLAEVRNELRRAQMTPDEVEDEQRTQLEAELAQMKRERDALSAARAYPDAFPVYERLMSAKSVEDQLKILSGLSASGQPNPAGEVAAAPAEGQDDLGETPPVDPNNPPGIPMGAMDRSLADRILGAFNEWPTFGR